MRRFDLNLAQRDLQAIIQMGLFDPLATKLFVEDGPRGGQIIIFQVKEYPIIRDLQYRGLKSATGHERLSASADRRAADRGCGKSEQRFTIPFAP
jgi:outer membrane protein insertion porin family